MIRRREPSYRDHTAARMVERMFLEGPEVVPLSSLLVLLEEEAGDADVFLHSASISWERPATPEEIQRSQEWHEKRRVATEKWERETYERLKAKYE